MKLSIISSLDPSVLGKRFALAPDGTLQKTSNGYLNAGNVSLAEVGSLGELSELIDRLAANQALAYGVASPENADIVANKFLDQHPGAITRSDKYFSWPRGAGVMMLDHDSGMTSDALITALMLACPQLASAGWMWRPSASSNVMHTHTGELLEGLRGQRVYVAAKKASDIPRAGTVLFKRLWLAGYGEIFIARTGTMLERTVVDAAVWQPSRLDFIGPPTYGPGLGRMHVDPFVVDGPALDTEAALPDLTDAEERRYRELVAEAKHRHMPQAAQVREGYVDLLADSRGVDRDEVAASLRMAEERQVLPNSFEVYLAYEDRSVTVGEILQNPSEYHGKICLDPVEPEYNNSHPVGKIYNDSKGAYIDSKAHGGRVFELGSFAALAFAQEASTGDGFAQVMDRIRRDGFDESATLEIRGQIEKGPFSKDERAIMTAALVRELKAGGHDLKTAKALAAGGDAAAQDSAVPSMAERLPMPAQGQVVPLDQPLNPRMWHPSHVKGKNMDPKPTVENFAIMTLSYGINIRFNEISKELEISIPGEDGKTTLNDESAISRLESLAGCNNYNVGAVSGGVSYVANRNNYNPVVDWISGAQWDGRDHIGQLFSQVQFAEDEDLDTCYRMFTTWMRCAVAAGLGIQDGCEPVLVVVDEAGGAGKTRFFRTLCPPDLRADSMTVDLRDKDSVKRAISTWLVELGELDGTFNRSDAAAMKSFLSGTEDVMRPPYGKKAVKYPRRTAFFGSVNERQFLIDASDNRRFWPMNVVALNHMHGVDVQQAWAQAAVQVQQGAPLYLSDEYDRRLRERNNTKYASGSNIADILEAYIPPEDGRELAHLNATNLLRQAGMPNPNKRDVNEAARWLRRHGFRETKNNGSRGFWIPNPSAAAGAFTGDPGTVTVIK